MRGEWIEILRGLPAFHQAYMSLPMRGEWIEIVLGAVDGHAVGSLPMRGEWIEM